MAEWVVEIGKSEYWELVIIPGGTEEDARLAFDMLRWRESQEERKAKLRLLRAQGTVEEKRATGEHVDRVEHTTRDPLDELRSRLDRLALTGEAGGDPRRSDG